MRTPTTPSNSTDDRLQEIGAILAAGLVRLNARKSSRKIVEPRESSLDFMVGQSGHEASKLEETARE